MSAPARCPCGSGESYPGCCGRFHTAPDTASDAAPDTASDAAPDTAPTAAALMRSRFSAFAVGDAAYLLRTWHPTSRPARLELDEAMRWTRLDIVDTVAGGPFDDDGVVEFRAHYRYGGRRGVLHERSRFVREGGRWLYLDGAVPPS